MTNDTKPKTYIPTAQQVLQRQREDHGVIAPTAKTPVSQSGNGQGTALAVPTNKSAIQQYRDNFVQNTTVGRPVKFDGKAGKFITVDDETAIDDDIAFTALVDQTLMGWVKFNGKGVPPTRDQGLPYQGFVVPTRDTLGDLDEAKWEVGKYSGGKPEDPWRLENVVILQRADTGELFSFSTMSKTGLQAVDRLTRHYDYMPADQYPIVKLKVGGYDDKRYGWVATPVFAVCGKTPKSGAATPDTSLAADLNDELPW